MNLNQLKALFSEAGCTNLYAKPLAENDNSKNQIYFAGAVETLNVFPSDEVFAENTDRGPSFKAKLKFGWLLENGKIAVAPNAQLILYAQYPEVRFSGFLKGCKAAPSQLMADRQRALRLPQGFAPKLVGRILFLGVTVDRQTLGYVALGDSDIAREFNAQTFPQAFVVFREISLPVAEGQVDSRTELLAQLRRINRLGWIDSKQLDSNRQIKPCNASQCGGFTLEAELGIPKNSDAEPDFRGWEVKQYAVDDFEKLETSKAITLLTPEPDGGFYAENSTQDFVIKFGYADKKGRADRINFGGRHKVDILCPATGLTMKLVGYDIERRIITNAQGRMELVSTEGESAASWSFAKLFKHWSDKHQKAAFVPSLRRVEPVRQYHFGYKVRLAQRTDSLRLLRAFATGALYYDPGIKLENASSEKPTHKNRSQFRVASKNIAELYETVETVEV